MSKVTVPQGYKPRLSLYETQHAIGFIKQTFAEKLSGALNLKRVSAPLFVEPQTGLNDDLNGIERPVEFDILETRTTAQIVHSLAKWKRQALHTYGFPAGEGLYTDMNAVRRDEILDNLHSIYVDQWDWEKVITEKDRNIAYLKETVTAIVNAVCDTQAALQAVFPALSGNTLSREISFVTTQELEDLYPALTPAQRETEYLKTHKTAFIMEIGGALKSGEKHDGRAPDYDDWKLNGDILFWNETLGCAFEVSSMGIRVNAESLSAQLALADCNYRRDLPFHKALLAGELPQTIGGGIGQSRLCLLLLEKAHIGEVQVSVWDPQTITSCKDTTIRLL